MTDTVITNEKPKILKIRCGIEEGRLLVDKFGPGGTSRCIEHSYVKDFLLNPIEFSALAGKNQSWKLAIKCEGKYLQHLFDTKVLLSCERKCSCTNCESSRARPTNLEYVSKCVYGSAEALATNASSSSATDASTEKSTVFATTDVDHATCESEIPLILIEDDLTDEFCTDLSPAKKEDATESPSKGSIDLPHSSASRAAKKSRKLPPPEDGQSPARKKSTARDKSGGTPELKQKQQRDIRSFFSPSAASPRDSAAPSPCPSPKPVLDGVSSPKKSTVTPSSAQKITPVKIRFESGELARICSTDEVLKLREEEEQKAPPPIKDEFLKATECKREYSDEPLQGSVGTNPGSADINPGSADVNPGSADINPGSADVKSDLTKINSGSADVKLGPALLKSAGKRPGLISKSTSSETKSKSANVKSVSAKTNSVSPVVKADSAKIKKGKTKSADIKSGSIDTNSGFVDIKSESADISMSSKKGSKRSFLQSEINRVTNEIKTQVTNGDVPTKKVVKNTPVQRQAAEEPTGPAGMMTGPAGTTGPSGGPRGTKRKIQAILEDSTAKKPKRASNEKPKSESPRMNEVSSGVSSTNKKESAKLTKKKSESSTVSKKFPSGSAQVAEKPQKKDLTKFSSKSPPSKNKTKKSPNQPKKEATPNVTSPKNSNTEKQGSPGNRPLGSPVHRPLVPTITQNGLAEIVDATCLKEHEQHDIKAKLTHHQSPNKSPKPKNSPLSPPSSATKAVNGPSSHPRKLLDLSSKKNHVESAMKFSPTKLMNGDLQAPSRSGVKKIKKEEFVLYPAGFTVKEEPRDPAERTSPSKLPPYTAMIKHALAELNSVGGGGCTKLEILLFILRTYKPRDDIAHVTNKMMEMLEVGIKKGLLLSSVSCSPRKRVGASVGSKPNTSNAAANTVTKPNPTKSDSSTTISVVKVKTGVKVKKEPGVKEKSLKIQTENTQVRGKIGLTLKRLKEPLASICRAKKMNRQDALKKVWVYIKTKKLLDPNDKSRIICDDKLRKMTKSKAITSKALLGFVKTYMEPL